MGQLNKKVESVLVEIEEKGPCAYVSMKYRDRDGRGQSHLGEIYVPAKHKRIEFGCMKVGAHMAIDAASITHIEIVYLISNLPPNYEH